MEVDLIQNIQNILENGVKNIVLTHHVIKWDFLKKQVVDTTKIATNKQVKQIKQIFIIIYKNFQKFSKIFKILITYIYAWNCLFIG